MLHLIAIKDYYNNRTVDLLSVSLCGPSHSSHIASVINTPGQETVSFCEHLYPVT